MGKYESPKLDETVATETVRIGDIMVKTFVANGTTGKAPLGIFFHGGGFVMGSVDQSDGFCRRLSRHCQIRIVSVGYRLAPEFAFPTAVEDGVHAVKWALRHYEADKVTLIGSSAGGNLAFATVLKLIHQGMTETLEGVVSLMPVTVHPDAVPDAMRGKYTAYDEYDRHTINGKSAMLAWLAAYNAPTSDPYLSVLLHPELKQLKRVYIVEGGADTLRDDARLMKEALETVGVPVMYDAYPGYPHFACLYPSRHLDEHRNEFFSGVYKGIQWVSGQHS